MMQDFNSIDQAERVPYFTFEEREVGIDTKQSEELGYPVPKIVTMILVTPHGHRAPLEFVADEWLPIKKKAASIGNYNYQWVKEFETGLANFREGKEVPRSGTPLRQYERIAKSRRESLSVRFPTVEDLAAVPDSGLNEIGLDGRVLRDLARGDIEAKKSLSPVVQELAEAKETIRRQEEALDKLSRRLEALEETKARKKTETA